MVVVRVERPERRRLARLPVARQGVVELQRPPRWHAEVGIRRRVTGGREGLRHGHPDRLMVAMTIGLRTGPSAEDDRRLGQANRPDELRHHGVATPALQRVLAALAIPEVDERAVQRLAARRRCAP